MRVRHLLLARLATQIRMHHLTLDRPRANERDLDDDVVEAARLETRQGVHLRAALHLEDPHRVRRAEIVVHGLVVEVERPQVDRVAAHRVDVLEAVLDERKHAKPEEIDLHEPHRFDVVLLPLDDGTVLHRRRLDGHDRRQRLGGEHESAHVDGPVARNVVHPFDDRRQRAHARVVGIEPGAAEQRARLVVTDRGARIAALVVTLAPLLLLERARAVHHLRTVHEVTPNPFGVRGIIGRQRHRLRRCARGEAIAQRGERVRLLHREAEHAAGVAHG